MGTMFTTPKGTEIELLKLKGKDYMLVAHRLLWFNEEVTNYDISSEFLLLTDEQTICRVTVTIKDSNGVVVKTATATKRETKRDFSDHTEKAESSALGRALSMLSFGTAQALADFDEGERLADAPLKAVEVKKEEPKKEVKPKKEVAKKVGSFNNNKSNVAESKTEAVQEEVVDGWD